MRNLTWIGFGDVAKRSLQHLHQDFDVQAVKRTPAILPDSARLQIADAKNQQQLTNAFAASPPEVVVVTLTPHEFSEQGYIESYLDPLRNITACCKTLANKPFIVFVSSTSIHEDNTGQWVDESSPVNPIKFSGKAMRECESLLRAYHGKSIVVRASGIYGPGRERMIQSVKNGDIQLHQGWTNRVHVEDLVRAIAHLIRLHLSNSEISKHEVYIVTDSKPTPQHECILWLAKALGIEFPDSPVDSAQSSRGGNKRLSNQKLLATGFQFRYSNFKEGYAEMICSRN